jgi:hypothetical protein
VLTKRPRRLAVMLADPGFVRQVGEAATEIIGGTPHGVWRMDMTGWTPEGGAEERAWMPPWPLPNVWVGTSIESDEYTWRADELRRAPPAIRFLSLAAGPGGRERAKNLLWGAGRVGERGGAPCPGS